MSRQELIENTIQKLNNLPDNKIIEVNDYIEFILHKIDETLLIEGIKNLDSNSFNFLADEQDIYSVNDLKEYYRNEKG